MANQRIEIRFQYKVANAPTISQKISETSLRNVISLSTQKWRAKTNRWQETSTFNGMGEPESRQNPPPSITKADTMDTINDKDSEFDSHGYFLEYQPQLNIKAKCIFCFEVLVRQRMPGGTIISPDIMLPRLLQRNQLHCLDQWVVANAVQQQREWLRLGHAVALSVNLTHQTLASASHNDAIIAMLRDAVAPIIIEITEQSAPAKTSRLEKAIADYHAAGSWVTLDDVGQAYGSLSLVNELDIDGIKIDRGFTRTISTKKGHRIMSSLLALGSEMKMAPVVEGVESAGEVRMLSEMGAVCMQGWLFGMPQKASVTTQMIDRFGMRAFNEAPYNRPVQMGQRKPH